MFVVMKDGKYFTGEVAPLPSLECIRWSWHPEEAKVWRTQRHWAQKAAGQWGGMVVELEDADRGTDENHALKSES